MKTALSIARVPLIPSVIAAITLATAASSQAALIAWGQPTNISGDSDVSTNGTLVGAANLGASFTQTTTLNGVTFTAWYVTANSSSGIFSMLQVGSYWGYGSDNAPFANLSPGYQSLLTSGALGSLGHLFHISALVVGQTYQFQWWSSTPSLLLDRDISSATAGHSVSLKANVSRTDGGLGQFAIGTFTADATTQTVRFGERWLLNAVQLRQVAVPEPGTALAGALAVGVCGMLRRRSLRTSSVRPTAPRRGSISAER